MMPTRETVEHIRKLYPPGTEIELIKSNDPIHRLHEGLKGTVSHVDDAGTIHMNWENGSSLGLIVWTPPGREHERDVFRS